MLTWGLTIKKKKRYREILIVIIVWITDNLNVISKFPITWLGIHVFVFHFEDSYWAYTGLIAVLRCNSGGSVRPPVLRDLANWGAFSGSRLWEENVACFMPGRHFISSRMMKSLAGSSGSNIRLQCSDPPPIPPSFSVHVTHFFSCTAGWDHIKSLKSHSSIEKTFYVGEVMILHNRCEVSGFVYGNGCQIEPLEHMWVCVLCCV